VLPIAKNRNIISQIFSGKENFMARKPELVETEKAAAPAEPAAEAAEVKKPLSAKTAKKSKTSEGGAAAPAKKAAEKPAKPTAKKAAKTGRRKAVEIQATKPAGRRQGQKKAAEKPVKGTAAKDRKAVGRKPGRKPGKKSAAPVPATARKKPGPKGKGLVGRKTDLLKMGEGAFLYSLDLQRQIEEMEAVIANYERVFEAVRVLFNREMADIEELVAGLLE
jgi:hypothetical protein